MESKKKVILTILFLLIAGSFLYYINNKEPEPNLVLFSPDAFAFDIGDSWEVNASVNAKGFKQRDNNDKWSINLNYSVDLILLNSDTLKSIFSNSITEEKMEKYSDIQLEAQIEIDSSFGEGDYKLIFNVSDQNSDQVKTILLDFNVMK